MGSSHLAAWCRVFGPWGLLLIAIALGPAMAQDARGTGVLLLDGRELEPIAYLERPNGVFLDPAPVARALGASLQTSPLQDSLTVALETKKFVFGPANTTLVTVPADGGRETIDHMALPPVKDETGIKVSVDLLQRIFGNELGIDFRWNAGRLEMSRRSGGELKGIAQVVHQYRVSTVEITFSAKPRFRVVRRPTSLEIQLLGDRFELRQPFDPRNDPLVRNVTAIPGGLAIEHVPEASAAEPRLLDGDGNSMVIDFFRRVETPQEAPRPNFFREDPPGLRTIVLDPGHGGSETGAVANGVQESVLTLQVAKLLKSRIEQKLPVKVVMTRYDDVEVPHAQRVALANQHKGDLFISLHFNSYQGARARGAETYFLSRAASDQLAAKLAESENASGDLPSSDLDLILWDLAQSHYLAESQRFAALVQQELNTALGLPDRGVRQAPFRVLVGTRMPAVLVELGFVSNAEEAARLQDPLYLDELVGALTRAIVQFRDAGAEPAEGAAPADGGVTRVPGTVAPAVQPPAEPPPAGGGGR